MSREHRSVGVILTLGFLTGVARLLVADAMVPATSRDHRQAVAAPNAASGVYSEKQATRGETAYRTNCARCHLDNLKGNDMAPALADDAFFASWESKSVRALYSLILSTMPSDSPGTLSENDVLDVVAYILQTNGFPAGKDELTRDKAEKSRITPRK